MSARLLVVALVAGALSLTAPVGPAAAAGPVPATPAGLKAAIEATQPYVGQSICDPVAKPGVAAFRDLVLRTYSGTTSLGIVKDCGIGGQSEHKEGRAWDWGVSAGNPAQVAQVKALLDWLFKTDSFGNTYAMARRLGLMYIIWNNKMWRSYNTGAGWQPYTGSDPHTGHVHFSFGWSGASKKTSYWTGSVAAVDYGPGAPKAVVPFRSPDNLAVLRAYGTTTLRNGSGGTAVAVVQKALHVTVDSSYGPETAAAVNRFKSAQRLAADGVFGPDTWSALFPPPIDPFGALEVTRAPGGIAVSGWAVDADSTDPLRTTVLVDGAQVAALTASLDRPDVAALYPASGAAHGYAVLAPVAAGSHSVCTYAVNAPGTPGANAKLGCATLTVTDAPTGSFDPVATTFGVTTLSGWALDPDSTDPVATVLTRDGVLLPSVRASAPRAPGSLWKGYGVARGFSETVTLPEGTHALCASAVNVAGTPGKDASLGCQTVTVRHSATGAFESMAQVPGGAVQLSGFAYDPDTAASVPVVVTWDGVADPGTPADLPRPDVATRYPGYGPDHGFTVSRTLPAGVHTVCVKAFNSAGTAGADAPIGCRTLTVAHSPLGALEVLRTQPGGTALLSGWALDPDTDAPAQVAVNVDGALHEVLTADVAHPGLPATWAAYGGPHGFTSTLTLPAGRHSVCAYPLNAPGTAGSRVSLGCWTVLVGTPNGVLEFANPGAGRIHIRGWVLDPDSTAPVTTTLVLDGRTVATLPASLGRADVASRFPGYGAAHGYARTLSAKAGRHTVCVYARNLSGTPGSNVRLGCRTMTVR